MQSVNFFPQNLNRWRASSLVYLHLTCNQWTSSPKTWTGGGLPRWSTCTEHAISFTHTLHHVEDTIKIPHCDKNYQFCQHYMPVKWLGSGVIKLLPLGDKVKLSMQFNTQANSLALVMQVQQQRPESLTVILTWHACKHMEFMYLVFTRMPGKSYHRQLWFLVLYLWCLLSTN